MSHPLEEKVAAIGRTARLLLLFYGVSCMVAALLLTAFGLGLADYLLRVEDLGVRLICTAMLVACGVAGFWLLVRPAWPVGRSLLSVAHHIEARFPELRDRLSSTLQFLQQDQDDPAAGSAGLRRAVVAETTAFVERLPLAETLNVKRPLGIGAAAIGLCLLLLSLCAIDATGAGLAFHRLIVPWAAPAWPQQNQLEFIDPPQSLAAGDDFVVTVHDTVGELPADVVIHYEFNDKPGEIISETMQPLLSPEGPQMTARLNNVVRAFRFRATGGDDHSMPWQTLRVADPPRLDKIKINIVPPAYTGLPELAASNGHLQALEGSTIEISGQTDKPLKKLFAVVESGKKQTRYPVTFDKSSFKLTRNAAKPWTVAKSGVYWLEATSATGVTTGKQQRWQLRATADQPPAVSLDKPASTLFVTAGSMVPLSAKVTDDLALQNTTLQYRLQEEGSGTSSIELWRDKPAAETRAPVTAVKTRSIDYQWDLAKLTGLTPGVRLRFFVSAEDYRPQTGSSTERELAIITRAELEDRIAQRQGYLLSQLAGALEKQKETRTQTRALEIQMNDVGKLAAADVDQLQSAELNQRQVQRQLNLDDDSIENQAAALLEDLKNNRIDNPDSKRRMQTLLDVVKGLGAEQLPGINRQLTAAMKTARDSASKAAANDQTDTKPEEDQPPEDQPSDEGKPSDEEQPGDTAISKPAPKFPVNPATTKAVAAAGARQDETIDKLKTLVDSLAKWDNYRRIGREVNQIRRNQEKVAAETSRQREQVEGKTTSELTPQQRADLKKIAQQQLELARNFDKLQNRMDQMQQQLAGSDPLAAETIADALDAARRTGLSGQMRKSGRELQKNRVGQSADTQKQIDRKLQDVLDVLANRREHELDRRLRKLQEAASQLGEVQQKQRSLRKQMEAAAGNANQEEKQRELKRLAAEQKQLAETARRLARQLERLQAEDASHAMQQAAGSMESAAQQGEQGDSAQADKEQEKSELELENAAQQIQQKQKQTEKDLFDEQMTRLKQSIEGMVQRQQGVVAETQRLEELRDDNSALSRAQRAGVAALAIQQRGLAGEALDFAQQVAQAQAFELALRGAAREMTRAASQLDRGETGAATLQAEAVALARLQQLLQALNPPEDPEAQPQPQQPPGGQGGAGGEQNGSDDGISRIAELNLLKLLQEEINRRTTALEKTRNKAGELPPAQQQEQDDLAVEQGQLAELLLKLSAPTTSNPEDDPGSLPDPTEDGAVLDDIPLDEELQKLLDDDAGLDTPPAVPPGPEPEQPEPEQTGESTGDAPPEP